MPPCRQTSVAPRCRASTAPRDLVEVEQVARTAQARGRTPFGECAEAAGVRADVRVVDVAVDDVARRRPPTRSRAVGRQRAALQRGRQPRAANSARYRLSASSRPDAGAQRPSTAPPAIALAARPAPTPGAAAARKARTREPVVAAGVALASVIRAHARLQIRIEPALRLAGEGAG
jgi:hypothetical protein